MHKFQRSATGFKSAVRKKGWSRTSHWKLKVIKESKIIKLIGIILYMGIYKTTKPVR